MPGVLETIATAFEELPRQATTLQDINLIQGRLGLPNKKPSILGGGSSSTAVPPTALVLPGSVYVHTRRTDDALPTFQSLARTSVPSVDATFQRRSEMLMQEMSREFSEFSLAGLAAADQQARNEGKVSAERAAEDAALAKIRFEEDAAIAARRALQDSERSYHEGAAGTAFRSGREDEHTALVARWRGKFAELAASLEEAVAAHEQQLALDAQRKLEEEARAHEAAARAAAEEASRASRHTELAEDARRLAELAALRLASNPSVRSLALVSADVVAPALAYACPQANTSLRVADRTWWKALHILEAEGLTPPLKSTDQAAALFSGMDDDADGVVPCADAAYLLALLASGSARDRVDAACDAPGAPAGGATLTPLAAARQLQLCARARKACALKLTTLLLGVDADVATMVSVPTNDSLERSVGTLFAGAASMPTDKFRVWAASTPTIAVLFEPLARH